MNLARRRKTRLVPEFDLNRPDEPDFRNPDAGTDIMETNAGLG